MEYIQLFKVRGCDLLTDCCTKFVNDLFKRALAKYKMTAYASNNL